MSETFECTFNELVLSTGWLLDSIPPEIDRNDLHVRLTRTRAGHISVEMATSVSLLDNHGDLNDHNDFSVGEK